MTGRRDNYQTPTTGEDSAAVLAEAIVSLGQLRDLGGWTVTPPSSSIC
ncbi:MAG: hypothetical protein ACLQCU_02560 [Acidimicrobiales bacterium]|jgi:hypothetical protein